MFTLLLCIYLFRLVFKRWEGDSPFEKMFISDNISYQEEMISYDGLKLKANVYLHDNDQNTFIIFHHGYHESYPMVNGIIENIYKQGYNVVLVFGRGNMFSEGKSFSMGPKEAKDFASWANHFSKKYPNSNIILGGWSMGGHITLRVQKEVLPPNVKGIIADCPYFTASRQFLDMTKGKKEKPSLVMRYAVYALNIYCKLFHGFSINEDISPILENSTLPALIMQGENDDLVLPYNTKKIDELYKGKHKVNYFKNAKHVESYKSDLGRYFDEFNSFVKDCINNENY
jgi:pimeloyl-ACP methyl ester carboxylesterase